MKNLILIFLLTIISTTLFSQDTISSNSYKRQIGLDIKPFINTFSGYVYGSSFLYEYEILYRKNLSSKYTFMAKLGYVPNEGQSLKVKIYVPEDSSQITNYLRSESHGKLQFNIARKIAKKKVNFYWGILAGVNLNNGNVTTIEFDTIPSNNYTYNIISNETVSSNFAQLVLGPNFGLDFPINDRWQILANFNFTAKMEFGRWKYTNAEKKSVYGNPYSGWTYNLQLLQDIGIMYSF